MDLLQSRSRSLLPLLVLLLLTAPCPFLPSYGLGVCPASAEGGQKDDYPYGKPTDGYGGKKTVTSVQDAQRLLKEYFSKRDVKIGDITEKEFYFEAEVLDGKNTLIDRVIVDKRTGRIRSIY